MIYNEAERWCTILKCPPKLYFELENLFVFRTLWQFLLHIYLSIWRKWHFFQICSHNDEVNILIRTTIIPPLIAFSRLDVALRSAQNNTILQCHRVFIYYYSISPKQSHWTDVFWDNIGCVCTVVFDLEETSATLKVDLKESLLWMKSCLTKCLVWMYVIFLCNILKWKYCHQKRSNLYYSHLFTSKNCIHERKFSSLCVMHFRL